jgi:hypothetical protein
VTRAARVHTCQSHGPCVVTNPPSINVSVPRTSDPRLNGYGGRRYSIETPLRTEYSEATVESGLRVGSQTV